jgi:hypothetical protein
MLDVVEGLKGEVQSPPLAQIKRVQLYGVAAKASKSQWFRAIASVVSIHDSKCFHPEVSGAIADRCSHGQCPIWRVLSVSGDRPPLASLKLIQSRSFVYITHPSKNVKQSLSRTKWSVIVLSSERYWGAIAPVWQANKTLHRTFESYW